MLDYWIERARDGDAAAARSVVESLRPRLERMAGYYARQCGEDADDLLQEAWVGLLEAVPTLDLSIGSPEQYLIRRAKWRLLDWVKRARVRRCAALEAEPADPCGGDAGETGVAGALVAEFAGQLNPTQRAVLRCLMDGLTWREAGSVLGCTSANVAYHVRRIRARYEAWSGGAAGLISSQ